MVRNIAWQTDNIQFPHGMIQSTTIAFNTDGFTFSNNFNVDFDFFIQRDTVEIQMDDFFRDRMQLNIFNNGWEIRYFFALIGQIQMINQTFPGVLTMNTVIGFTIRLDGGWLCTAT